MKSAYEIAMERLEKEDGPTQKLSEEQKEQIAEIEKICKSKIAESELSFESKLAQATDIAQLEALRAELKAQVSFFEEKAEEEKDKIWDS